MTYYVLSGMLNPTHVSEMTYFVLSRMLNPTNWLVSLVVLLQHVCRASKRAWSLLMMNRLDFYFNDSYIVSFWSQYKPHSGHCPCLPLLVSSEKVSSGFSHELPSLMPTQEHVNNSFMLF